MRMACRKTSLIKNLYVKVPDFAEINNFDIKEFDFNRLNEILL